MVKELENIEAKMNWHWRDTMRTVRFLSFDARVAFLIPIWLVYLRWSTIILSFLVFYMFKFFENRGLTFPAAMRSFRGWLIGRERPGVVGAHNQHKFKDYG
ncbi:MAG: IcmT/TraK family protein [Alphaproteobacteria bacterium]